MYPHAFTLAYALINIVPFNLFLFSGTAMPAFTDDIWRDHEGTKTGSGYYVGIDIPIRDGGNIGVSAFNEKAGTLRSYMCQFPA